MRFDYFIAKKIYSDLGVKGNFSRPAIRIATSGIAIGTIVMLLSITILQGFKKDHLCKCDPAGSSQKSGGFW